MERYFLLFPYLICFLTVPGICQNDSLKLGKFSHEISLGMPMFPWLYPSSAEGIVNGRFNNVNSLAFHPIYKSDFFVPFNINVNYRLFRKGEEKVRFGILLADTRREFEGVFYSLISVGKGVDLNMRGSIKLNTNILTGYLEYSSWAVGGMFTYPKFYDSAKLFISGVDLGLTFQYNISKKWFLENEIYVLAYGIKGKVYYDKGNCSACSGVSDVSKIDITLLKLLGINVGYRL